jgi:hypothetical protein
MNDQALFELVRKADPLPAAAGFGEPSQALLERVLASARDERRRPRALQHRRRLVLVAAALALGAAAAGFAIAGSGWLTGEPAPPAVVTDFQAYTPQLGFHPDPGSAVLVAQDGQIKLYATTNREGTYCLVLEDPWRSPTTLDGGTCVPEAIASGHFIAGLVGAATQTERQSTLVVGGRIADRNAQAVRFTGPDGKVIERPVGPSGFFVATVSTREPCANGDWISTFTALDANGEEIAQITIPLTQTTPMTPSQTKRGMRACDLSPLRK